MDRKEMLHLKNGVMKPVRSLHSLRKLELEKGLALFSLDKLIEITGKTNIPLLSILAHRFADAVSVGHSPADVAAFKAPDSKTMLEYQRAVLEQTKHYISNLSETELKRELNNPVFPTAGARLVGVISDNLQHAGQAAYVRGLLKGKGWSGI